MLKSRKKWTESVIGRNVQDSVLAKMNEKVEVYPKPLI